MLDLLLIYPPLSVNERYSRNLGNIGGHQPPLGLACLAAYIREKGFTVKIVDAQADGMTTEDTALLAKKENPKVVGIGALTSIFHRAVECADGIRASMPDTLIVFGGHHATIMPEESIEKAACFDLLCKGEGELTLVELLERYRDKDYNRNLLLGDFDTLRAIRGLVFREGSIIVSNPGRPLIEELDLLPLPARDLLNMKAYKPLPNQYKRMPLLNATISRGCPYACSYCSASAVFGRGIRMRSPAKTVEEIKFLMKNYGAREISFWDDTLTLKEAWLSELCSLILKENLDIVWTCYSRVDTVTRPMLKMMKKAGCWNIFFGFESGDQKILDIIGKNITLEQIRNVCKWCKEAGIEIRASFMLALPSETPELAKKTIDFAIEVNPEYAQFCLTTPFPKTRLYDEAKRYGILDNDFSKYNVWQPVFVPYGYRDKEEILAMERLAIRKFYLRPKYILGKMGKIRSLTDLLRYIKGTRVVFGFLR